MIYNDKFVWLHFPKCAGSQVERLFSKYFSEDKSIFQDPVGLKLDPTLSWHNSIKQREKNDPKFKLGDRIIICSFRKLPSWLESRYNYEYKRSPHLLHRPELVLQGKFHMSNGEEGYADNLIKKYLPKKILDTGKVRFLRTEFFESDFRTIFGEFLDLSTIPDDEYQQKTNRSSSSLPSHIKEMLYNNKIYDTSPLWKSVEKIVY